MGVAQASDVLNKRLETIEVGFSCVSRDGVSFTLSTTGLVKRIDDALGAVERLLTSGHENEERPSNVPEPRVGTCGATTTLTYSGSDIFFVVSVR